MGKKGKQPSKQDIPLPAPKAKAIGRQDSWPNFPSATDHTPGYGELVEPAPAECEDSDAQRILPCEAEGPIPEKFAAFSAAGTAAERDALLLEILEEHPFVKKGNIEVSERPQHRFEIRRFQLDVRKFQKWIQKDEVGKTFREIAGGVSDDGLYTLSPILRVILPRGTHSVKVVPKEGEGAPTTFLFRGIPKFTGLEARDEDEDSNSHQANFFYGGARFLELLLLSDTD